MVDAQRLRVGWTEQQWGAIDAAVASEVIRVRVVGHVIPTTKVGAIDKAVTIDQINPVTRTIDDVTTIPLPEISIQFLLDLQQVQQPELTRALSLVRRAANDFARIEDEVLLRGLAFVANRYQPDGRPLPPRADIQRGRDRAPFDGLAGNPRNVAFRPRPPRQHLVQMPRFGQPNFGPLIVAAVPQAIGFLESAGHMGPYHLLLGELAFVAALHRTLPRWYSRRTGSNLSWPRPFDVPRRLIRTKECLFRPGAIHRPGGGCRANAALHPTTALDQYLFRVYGVLAIRRKEPEAVVRLLFRP